MIYGDTSFWIALKMAVEKHHEATVDFFEENEDKGLVWSPWNRVENFNTIRQLPLQKISLAEARQGVVFLERDVRLGYFIHREADWRDVLRAAHDISAEHALSQPSRAADLLHVAYAVELAVETLVTFDDAQFELAKAAGLQAIKPS